MEGVYERTGLCPYTQHCDSYRSIANGEHWMKNALSKMRREGADSLSQSEGGYTLNGLLSKLAHLRRVKNRCYSGNRRCLRFWQFDRKNKHHISLSKMRMRTATEESIIKNIPATPVSQDNRY